MINILKQREEWVTASRQNKFEYATLKLTLFYVLSTALILLVSSMAVLVIFTPKDNYEVGFFDDDHLAFEVPHDEFSLYEIRENLPTVIAIVDLVILAIVSILAYFFARRTLMPIKEMYESQQQFMSDVAHELRTPLSVMRSGADATLRKDRTVKEYEDFIVDVRGEADRLTRLTNQLLQMLRIGQIENTDFSNENLSLLLKRVVENFTPYATEKGVLVRSEIESGVYLETSKDALIEVLQNLLKNATDYNRKEGAIDVSLAHLASEVIIKIVDTGIGIPKDKTKVIFERFVKVDTARTETLDSGAGLGLAIVQNLVSKLGGVIELSSEIGVGTTVKITLPKVHS